MTGPLPAARPKAASGSAANIPVELIDLRNKRRLRPSFCMAGAPREDLFCVRTILFNNLVNGGHNWQMPRWFSGLTLWLAGEREGSPEEGIFREFGLSSRSVDYDFAVAEIGNEGELRIAEGRAA